MAIQTDTGTLDPVKFTDNLSEFILPFEPSEALDPPAQKEATTTAAEYENDQHTRDSCKYHFLPRASSATEVKLEYMKGQPTCLSRLRQIREFLLWEEPPAPFLVQQTLGHGVLAGK